MAEKTKNKLDTATKYFNRLVFSGLAAVIGVFFISYYEKAGNAIDMWVAIPETVKAVKTQPVVDSLQNVMLVKIRHDREIDSLLRCEQARTTDMKFDIIINGINGINKKIGNNPIFVPKSAYYQNAELSQKLR